MAADAAHRGTSLDCAGYAAGRARHPILSVVPAAAAHHRAGVHLPVRADVRGHHRVQELQAAPRHHRQRLGRPASLHPFLRVAELLAADPQHHLPERLRVAGGVPDPDHPGADDEHGDRRALQAYGADGHLRPPLHLHGGDRRHAGRVPVQELRSGQPLHRCARRPAAVLPRPEQWFRSLYVFSGVWQNAGWGTIIYLAALSAIDPQLHEAAIVDGAT